MDANPVVKDTEESLFAMLAVRYQGPEWILFRHVPDAKSRRYADVIGFSTWGSRGHTLRGFEIKVSRSDWLAEVKNPEKAGAFAHCVHDWYVVSAPGVVQPHEVPKTWGWIERHGSRLVQQKKAAVMSEASDVNVHFVARLFVSYRNEQERAMQRLREARLESIDAEVEKRLEHERERLAERATRDSKDAVATLQRFEAVAGFALDTWDVGRVAHVAKVLHEHDTRTLLTRLGHARTNIETVVKKMDELAAALDLAAEGASATSLREV